MVVCVIDTLILKAYFKEKKIKKMYVILILRNLIFYSISFMLVESS